MHRHRDEDRATPLISESKTASQDKERRERRQMRVHGGKEQRVGDQPEKATEITPQNAVEEETKEKFLGRGRNGDGENDDHDPLLDRARAIEKLDDALFTRTASEDALRNGVSEGDQRISRQQQDRSHAQST